MQLGMGRRDAVIRENFILLLIIYFIIIIKLLFYYLLLGDLFQSQKKGEFLVLLLCH